MDATIMMTLVDEWLALTASRDMFTSDECADRLLDIRRAASPPAEEELLVTT